jgi:hypothetical protein
MGGVLGRMWLGREWCGFGFGVSVGVLELVMR